MPEPILTNPELDAVLARRMSLPAGGDAVLLSRAELNVLLRLAYRIGCSDESRRGCENNATLNDHLSG
jgi:hypothetical protein